MTKSIFDTLIFIFLIVIIIYTLAKMFGLIEPCRSKSGYYRGYEYNEYMDNVPKKVTFNLDEQSVTNSLNDLFDGNKQQKLSESIKNLSEKYKKPITTNADHVLSILHGESTNVPQQTAGVPQQTVSVPQQTGEPHITQDFNTYQNNFYNFNDNVNYSSSTELNVTDKLNEYNNNIDRFSGMKISDIYDDLVESKYCVNKNCVINGLFDGISNNTFHSNNGSTGLYMQNVSKKYETDDVNTGGKFYDNIEGVEDDFCGNMVL
jgi:hypothetical protein